MVVAPPLKDAPLEDPWFVWDCDNTWPLIGDLLNIICDFTQNLLNLFQNDDYITNIYVNPITNEQEFSVSGGKVKIKLVWQN